MSFSSRATRGHMAFDSAGDVGAGQVSRLWRSVSAEPQAITVHADVGCNLKAEVHRRPEWVR